MPTEKPKIVPLTPEGRLQQAIEEMNLTSFRVTLRDIPGIDINWRDQKHSWETFLHSACSLDRVQIIALLLAHPSIDVNQKDKFGTTPFMIACSMGHTASVRLLLKDSRLRVNEPDKNGHTPLKRVAYNGHLDIIRWWIASGREMDLGKPGDVEKSDAIAGAKKYGKTDVVTLLERFKENPEETRHAVRLDLGLVDELAAEMFALVVFVSDGLLRIKDTISTPAARFFSIARRLPLEIQMLLCYRVEGSPKEIIPGKKSEVAFKELARRLW